MTDQEKQALMNALDKLWLACDMRPEPGRALRDLRVVLELPPADYRLRDGINVKGDGRK